MSLLTSLKNQKEFDAVNHIGRKHVGKFMIVIIAAIPSSDENSPLFRKSSSEADHASSGILLGMKVGRKFGNAVIRNKFKRRMRDIVRNYAKTTSGKAFIIIPKSYASKAGYAELLHDFNKF